MRPQLLDAEHLRDLWRQRFLGLREAGGPGRLPFDVHETTVVSQRIEHRFEGR